MVGSVGTDVGATGVAVESGVAVGALVGSVVGVSVGGAGVGGTTVGSGVAVWCMGSDVCVGTGDAVMGSMVGSGGAAVGGGVGDPLNRLLRMTNMIR